MALEEDVPDVAVVDAVAMREMAFGEVAGPVFCLIMQRGTFVILVRFEICRSVIVVSDLVR